MKTGPLGIAQTFIPQDGTNYEVKSGGTTRPILDLPIHVVASLTETSGLLQSAAEELGQPRECITKYPHQMIGQLIKAAENIERQSRGIQDGYGYDMDMVHQRMALSLRNAIIWAREGFQ